MQAYSHYESKIDIQIVPYGEEEFHTFDFECYCEPHITIEKGKPTCKHYSWSDEDILDLAEDTPFHTVRQELSC